MNTDTQPLRSFSSNKAALNLLACVRWLWSRCSLLLILSGGVIEANAAAALLNVTPSMLSGPLVFFATPAGVEFAEPIPYGFANNLTDSGWIWPNDNTGQLVLDFGVPTALTRFRVYCTYNGGERGASWAIEHSSDNSVWISATDFAYQQSNGGGVDDSGTPVDGFGGWYEANFNEAGVADRYWRIRQTEILVAHAPRSGQFEFYGLTGPSPKPLVKSTSPSGNTVRKTANITVELEDGVTSQVAPASIQLILNGQSVTPTLNKPAGTNVTTVSYDPPGDLPESTNTVRIIFGDTSTPPIVQTNDFSFVVINDEKAALIVNLDFNGVRNDPGPDLPGPTFSGEGAGGGGSVWNGLNADSRVDIGIDDNDNLTVSGNNLLDSIGGTTPVGFTISPVGGDVRGTATTDPTSRLALFSDEIFVGFGAQITLTADFTISGLDNVPVVDLYFYIGIGSIAIAGAQEGTFETIGNFNKNNTRVFRTVPVSGGTIKGSLNGDPGRLAGLTIVRPAPHPFVRTVSPTGSGVRTSSSVAVELEDYVTEVASGSIQLFLNGQSVSPTVTKPAGSKVTTISYDPPGALPEGNITVRTVFGDTSTPAFVQTNEFSFIVISDAQLAVTPAMLSGPLVFFASPAGLTFTNPIPYGLANNVSDIGWIWPTNAEAYLAIDFGTPTAVAKFRVYSTFPGAGRGAIWAIEHSTDNVNWINSVDFTFETTAGGGVNDDGTPRTDYGGWYQVTFNSNGDAFQYWRVNQTAITLVHGPRAGQMEFYGALREPSVKSTSPTGGGVQRDAAIRVELQDNITQVAPASIQLFLNAQAVTPSVSKPAGESVTTVTYDPPGDLPQSTNIVKIIFSNNATPPAFQTNEFWFVVEDQQLDVTFAMLSGSLTFFASPAGLTFTNPIPYGIANNVNDSGWIWPSDNTGVLAVDFGIPTALNKFRIYSTFPGGGRGANWAIEYSDDNSTWTKSTDFLFETTAGGGVNDDGTPRTDFGGWYQAKFNSDDHAARFWRVRQTAVTVSHAPRAGEVQFYGAVRPPVVVTPEMLSGPTNFFASPAGLTFTNPVPYGITNNVADNGWIWPSDNTGELVVDFGLPIALSRFRVYSTFPGGGRGANWAIEYSDDNSSWTKSADFPFETIAGGGVNEDGSARTDFGGWYETTFNNTGKAGRYWRVKQTAVTVSHAPRAGEFQFYGSFRPPLTVTPAMLSGSTNFFASPAGLSFTNPIPYGIVNNVNDNGWIWPSDNSGVLVVDFGISTAVNAFRVFSTFPGGGRGANWAIEYSDDNSSWTKSTDFAFETKAGGGVDDDGSRRSDFGGWYRANFNSSGTAARYWRVRQTAVTVSHAPRAGEMEFYAAEPAISPPLELSIARQGTDLVISWSGTATLQEAGEVSGAWADIPGATSPRTITPSGTRKFYRLRQ